MEIRILDGILKLLNAISLNTISQPSIQHNYSSKNFNENNHAAHSNLDPHFIQILTACKCLFVSHRKIAIYLGNGAANCTNQRQRVTQIIDDSNADTSSCSTASSSTCLSTYEAGEKLYLSNIRIPLSWKWSDYLKASKNSGKLIKLIIFYKNH